MRTVVDTSALVALLYPDDEHNEQAAALLREAAEEGKLVVNALVYAELAADPYFASRDDLDAFLDDTGIVVEDISRDAQFSAGEAFGTYLDRCGDGLQCSECGHQTIHACPECESTVTTRQHVASDFLVGAHGEEADALLTFDTGFYRDYFDAECRSVRDG